MHDAIFTTFKDTGICGTVWTRVFTQEGAIESFIRVPSNKEGTKLNLDMMEVPASLPTPCIVYSQPSS